MVMKQLSYSGLIIALLCVINVPMACASQNLVWSSIDDGIVKGIARIITSSSQLSKVCRGDIVVARMTTVSWESVLCLAAGIITDHGDSNSHAALFGKKMGIPVIVGVGNATKVIDDGQVVVINSSKNSFYVEPVAGEDAAVAHYGAMHKATGNYVPHTHSTTSSSAQRTGTAYCRGNAQGQKESSSIKELYDKHHDRFERYVLALQEELNWGLKWVGVRGVEWGAKATRGFNDFTISCMAISYPFFGKNKSYISGILKLLSSDKYLQHIEHSIERCKKKPGNVKWLDWVSQVAHEEHIKNITLPAGVQKERLIAEPKEYGKIIHKVSAEERDALIAVGLFSRYLAEQNILLRT